MATKLGVGENRGFVLLTTISLLNILQSTKGTEAEEKMHQAENAYKSMYLATQIGWTCFVSLASVKPLWNDVNWLQWTDHHRTQTAVTNSIAVPPISCSFYVSAYKARIAPTLIFAQCDLAGNQPLQALALHDIKAKHSLKHHIRLLASFYKMTACFLYGHRTWHFRSLS